MKILINTTKSIEDNATHYYDKSKKAKRKLEGLKKAITISNNKIKNMEEDTPIEKIKYQDPPEIKWYMKFRWFISSDGFLCIGGRDAPTNEIIIKKHTEKDDLVFHTEKPGSPFFVIKSEGKTIPQQTKEETAIATASFSRAWREGLITTEVYSITPEQVKKDPGLHKGSYMIYGKREYYKPTIKLYVGLNAENYIECSPVKKEFLLKQGGKVSETAKRIQKSIMVSHEIKFPLDDIVRVLPGDCSIF
ncbi:MAG: NFACT RNA binding domain-containing protein [Nanoarchaeota archaeon]|nr:NFACT RNA binding domain-containing protein [Nanoarchaeota archaeon]